MQNGGVELWLRRATSAAGDHSPAELADAAKPLEEKSKWTRVGKLHLDRIESGAPRRPEFSNGWCSARPHLVEGVDVYPGDEIMAARATGEYPASHVARAEGCGMITGRDITVVLVVDMVATTS